MAGKDIYPGGSTLLPERGLSGTSGMTAGEKYEKEKKLKKACADFESIFVYQMLKTMRGTVPGGGLFNKMTGKDTYDMIMDQKMSEELTAKGGLGIQEMLFRQLQRKK